MSGCQALDVVLPKKNSLAKYSNPDLKMQCVRIFVKKNGKNKPILSTEFEESTELIML